MLPACGRNKPEHFVSQFWEKFANRGGVKWARQNGSFEWHLVTRWNFIDRASGSMSTAPSFLQCSICLQIFNATLIDPLASKSSAEKFQKAFPLALMDYINLSHKQLYTRSVSISMYKVTFINTLAKLFTPFKAPGTCDLYTYTRLCTKERIKKQGVWKSHSPKACQAKRCEFLRSDILNQT